MICLSAQSGFAKCRRCCPRWTAPHGRSFDQIYTATQATIAVCHPVEAANIVIWTESCEEVHRALLQFPSRMTVSQAAGRALVMLMTRRVAKFAGTMVLLLAIAIFQPLASAVAQPTPLDHRVPSARSQFYPSSPATGQFQRVTPQLRTSDGPPRLSGYTSQHRLPRRRTIYRHPHRSRQSRHTRHSVHRRRMTARHHRHQRANRRLKRPRGTSPSCHRSWVIRRHRPGLRLPTHGSCCRRPGRCRRARGSCSKALQRGGRYDATAPWKPASTHRPSRCHRSSATASRRPGR